MQELADPQGLGLADAPSYNIVFITCIQLYNEEEETMFSNLVKLWK